MDIKQQAYQLLISGMSYGQIAKKLGIGKTTAFDYVKEAKLSLNEQPQQVVRNGSELGPNDRSDKAFDTENNPGIVKELTSESDRKAKSPIKEFTGDDLIQKVFDCLEFEDKFLELIGRPSRIFSAIIWGLPKGGKSNLALRFADYLQEYFGEVVYIAAEEGESVTLQEKFKEIGGSKVTVAESKNKEDIREYLKSRNFDFVFIDSINTAGIDSDFLEILKQENPKKSFISIVQATKGGNFKGDQALTHNCDFIIKVVAGIAYHSGRFNTATEINIFEAPLYKKNPNVRPKKVTVNSPAKANTEEKPFNSVDWGKIFSHINSNDAKKAIEIGEKLNDTPQPVPPLKLPDINSKILPIKPTPSYLPYKKPVSNKGGTGNFFVKAAGVVLAAAILNEMLKPNIPIKPTSEDKPKNNY